MKRVVVTGMSAITALGQDWSAALKFLQNNKSAVVRMDDWDKYPGLRTRLGSPIPDFEIPSHYTRKQKRTMGRVSILATRATELALLDADLLNSPEVQNGDMGIAYGSCSGSPEAIKDFGGMLITRKMDGINASTYIRMMPHTTAVNIGVFFGVKGRIITTCSACTSGSQGIGYAYEAVKYGLQKTMIAGGAEELDVTQAAIFDTLFATSTRNDSPEASPRPFDKGRDGLVIGEGAGTFILEELEHAQARGAKIYAEIVGFHTNSDGSHVTQPNPKTMQKTIELALKDADISPDDIGYINAHGTATDRGDIAESIATNKVFGKNTPTSSLKSYLGHTLGACGVIESWMSIMMMNSDWYAPTINLETVDPKCAELDYIRGQGRTFKSEYVMNNNFAFGGINTSLIFQRWQ